MGNILVFAEHQKGKFPKSTLVALQAGKEAASKLGGDCLVAVLGHPVRDLLPDRLGGAWDRIPYLPIRVGWDDGGLRLAPARCGPRETG